MDKEIQSFQFIFIGQQYYFITSKAADKTLKNHYIISNKTSINNEKNTNKKQICNQQEISLL